MSDQKRELLRTLVSLQDSPTKQAAFAVDLLAAKNGIEVVRAALDVLAKHPDMRASPALHELYWHYAEKDGKRDPGAYTRTGVLKALRPVLGVGDVELVVHAATTYERYPPDFREETALLRSTAIVLLSELDDRLAAFFATRLLADGYTEPMSGEPALTAVRVLAAMGELLPLYFYATHHQEGGHAEVLAECLRNLGYAPEAVVREIVEQFADSEDRAALVGLFDMLTLGPGSPRHVDFLTRFLQATDDLDLYRYLVTLMVTSPNADVRCALAEAVAGERETGKVEVLREAVAIAPNAPELKRLQQDFA